MKKALQEMRTYTVRWICECGGELKHNGHVLTTHPPMYPHECDTCEHKETLLGESYPCEQKFPVGDESIVDFE